MGLKVKRYEQPIESATIARKGFAPVVVTRAEDSDLIRIGVDKEGVQAYLFSDAAAKELAEAIQLFTK